MSAHEFLPATCPTCGARATEAVTFGERDYDERHRRVELRCGGGHAWTVERWAETVVR